MALLTPAPQSREHESDEQLSVRSDLQKFKFLAAKISTQSSSISSKPGTSSSSADKVNDQLAKYFVLIHNWQQSSPSSSSTGRNSSSTIPEILLFWQQNSSLDLIAPIAQDLLCAPASQASVERMFSVSGYMSSGRRSSMTNSLQMRVFLKVNKNALKETGF